MLDPYKRYDFTNCPLGMSTYQGANGAKISIVIDNEEYMLKFPAQARKNDRMHYSNGIISEFVGSRIFEILGIPAQKTYLGIYEHRNGKRYEVVACKDFTEQGRYAFHDFGSLKNSIITSPSNGYGTEIDSVVDAIDEQLYIDPQKLSDFFWNMNVVDALLANFDRHNGNWGFRTDNRTGEWSIAPIFDCGSSLYPQADDETRRQIMTSRAELGTRLYQRPLSAFKAGDRKIAYHDLLQAGMYPDCEKAVIRMGGIIDERIVEIHRFIAEAPIREEDKTFFDFMIDKRKEAIIDASMEKILNLPSASRKKAFKEKYGISRGLVD